MLGTIRVSDPRRQERVESELLLFQRGSAITPTGKKRVALEFLLGLRVERERGAAPRGITRDKVEARLGE